MDDIKEYLRTGKRGLTPEMLDTLRAYDFVLYNGRRFSTKDLMEEMRGCEHCCRLLLRVCSLETLLEKYQNSKTVVDLDVVLRDFLEKKYTRTSARVYSRRVLFKEVQIFLEEKFEIHLLHPTDERYRRFIQEIVGDTRKGYKRLRIRKIT
tara:strand:- start:1543 stop:1995 length:453 start_codon:yes stop_codon:yes gene_type:complete